MSAPSESKTLFIDLGHSRIKWARGRNGQLDPGSVAACSTDDIRPLLARLTQADFDRLWWSPQGHDDLVARLQHEFDGLGLSCRAVTTGSLALPVAPAYPQLGSDRWLALQWPHQAAPGALCVVDCGTAVTVDLVDRAGRHLGGWIMAGLKGLRRGLGGSARHLPDALFEHSTDPIEPAIDSARAIGRGLDLQLIGGLRAALDQAERCLGRTSPDDQSTQDRPTLWLTGGDALRVEHGLGRSARVDLHLVLRGLALAEAHERRPR